MIPSKPVTVGSVRSLPAYVTSVDVYYVTNQNADGGVATCASGDTLNIGTYEFILGWSGSGVLSATGCADNVRINEPGITGGDGSFMAAGTLSITVVGLPYLFLKTASDGTFPQAQTLFGSDCPGLQQDNKLRLGVDIPREAAYPVDCFGSTIGVQTTTWGRSNKGIAEGCCSGREVLGAVGSCHDYGHHPRYTPRAATLDDQFVACRL